MTSARDLFDQVVSDAQAHQTFQVVKQSKDHSGARRIMNDLFARRGDPNGNFLSDFQSDGFYSRMFELACQAYLESIDLSIDHSHEAPDFLVSSGPHTVAIEAVTGNPQVRRGTDITVRALPRIPLSPEDMLPKCQDEFPIRMGRILMAKRRMRYWDLPHCKGLPFVLIVGPFHGPGSQFYPDESLCRYLYGVETFPDWVERNGLLVKSARVTRHEYEGRSITSDFFDQPGSENISGVIYANPFSVFKFIRMAMEAGLQPGLRALRRGYRIVPRFGRTFEHEEFHYYVAEGDAPEETWRQGLTLFVNPRANHPLPENILSCTSRFKVVDGLPVREIFDFHPLASTTITFDAAEQPESTNDERAG